MKCQICGREQNRDSDRLSASRSGDCWVCIGEIEAETGDKASLEKVRDGHFR